MTGGAGFARDAMNSLRRNRALLKKRKKMGENPYMKEGYKSRSTISNYDELQQWKTVLQKRRQKTTWIIITAIVLGTLLVAILFKSFFA